MKLLHRSPLRSCLEAKLIQCGPSLHPHPATPMFSSTHNTCMTISCLSPNLNTYFKCLQEVDLNLKSLIMNLKKYKSYNFYSCYLIYFQKKPLFSYRLIYRPRIRDLCQKKSILLISDFVA